jgi:tRNA threonylcarbamoyladenosine biosynthesis protein TsaE
MQKISSKSVLETAKVATDWLRGLCSISNKNLIIGLSGNLGTGKTAFVKEVAKYLGVDQSVTSPTFVIMKKYETKDDKWKSLIHIDAYRLSGAKELEKIGFQDFSKEKNTMTLVEWPENVDLDSLHVDFMFNFEQGGSENERIISISRNGY